MKRILFLDIDGVLNYRAVFVPGNPAPICPQAWARCKRVIEATGAKIVLSSTWRKGVLGADRHLDKLKSIGLFPLTHADWRTPFNLPPVGEGPLAEYPKRGDEIASWLSDHPEVTHFAIIDDDSDMLENQNPFFVRTDFDTGLLDWHCDKLIEILGARS
jgi:hypothetical protein